MIITAGDQQINVRAVYEEKRTLDDEQRDTIRLVMDGALTADQLTALQNNTLSIDDSAKTYEGYTVLHEHYLVLAKGPDGALLEARTAAARAEQEAAEKTQTLKSIATALPDSIASQHPQIYDAMKFDGALIKSGTRINWNGQLMRAAVDLWDNEQSTPDAAPALWESIDYYNGYRIIPETITATLAFAKDEIGYWPLDEHYYRAVRDGVVHTPAVYPDDWEVVQV